MHCRALDSLFDSQYTEYLPGSEVVIVSAASPDDLDMAAIHTTMEKVGFWSRTWKRSKTICRKPHLEYNFFLLGFSPRLDLRFFEIFKIGSAISVRRSISNRRLPPHREWSVPYRKLERRKIISKKVQEKRPTSGCGRLFQLPLDHWWNRFQKHQRYGWRSERFHLICVSNKHLISTIEKTPSFHRPWKNSCLLAMPLRNCPTRILSIARTTISTFRFVRENNVITLE